MEHTVKDLHDLCNRLDQLGHELFHRGGINPGAVEETVQIIQRIGEILAWAYGQRHRPNLGEQFAQPFVDRHLRDRLRDLLFAGDAHLQAQVLQTIHILLAATPDESTLFCAMTAGWYLNQVVTARFDFRTHEDLLPLWMTVVKDIATMMTSDNLMLFYDPSAEKPFPIYSEAIQYYHHPISQVRTHVQATTLEVFINLKNEDSIDSGLFQLVLADSAIFFTHVCCLLRDFWRMTDEAVRSGVRRDVRSAICIQNDILMYLNDIFMCEIPQLSSLLQEKLLRFAVLPVLLGSALRFQQQAVPAQDTTWYLLCDLLATLRSPHVLRVLAASMLRPTVAEEILQLVSLAPPRTPTSYFAMQASWGGAAQPGPFDLHDLSSDEALYAASPVPVMTLLENRGRPFSKNKLLDALEERLCDLGSLSGQTASCIMAALELLLQALRTSGEVIDSSVADRLGAAVCDCLARYKQVPWAVCLCALRALRELIAAADVPAGRSHQLLGPVIREKVLTPLADELLREAALQSQQGWSAQEMWLRDFQEQWLAFSSDLSELPETSLQGPTSIRHELPEPGQEHEAAGAPPPGRARCLRILLAVQRVASARSRLGMEMPGLNESEREESLRFQPGVPVNIGKMNRVKCYAHGPTPGLEKEPVYLLPAQHTLLLVRPDDQKPFWAVPVIAEPLRLVRLAPGDENSGSVDLQRHNGLQGSMDPQRTLQLEVSSSRSPHLRTVLPQSSWNSGGLLVPGHGYPGGDHISRTVPTMPGTGNLGATMDFMANSMPSLKPGGATDQLDVPVPLTLSFSDERRRRVAWKVIAQAQHQVCQRLSEGVVAFLSDLKQGVLPSQ
eukprot:TRINITY_DN47926_c0_g1_i1.p1 TRINITY_DN47926_c0_g1~~TRINITY_DN47926_c0_g1_i1.p1  ORF type:complete len:841 (+),score=168.40 TRINITY_DN47926_c0_g1_i1:33-2555(+)